MSHNIPEQVIITLTKWDENQAGYSVQIGTHSHTIAYAWRPFVPGDDADAIVAEVNEIADRLVDSWNDQRSITDLMDDNDRIERNRDMWRDQCARQAAALTQLRADNAELNQMVRALKGDQPIKREREPFVAWEAASFADGDIIEIRERDGSKNVMKIGSPVFVTALRDLGPRMPVRAATEEQRAPWVKNVMSNQDPSRESFEEADRLIAAERNCEMNPANIDVYLGNRVGWSAAWALARLIEKAKPPSTS